MVKEWKKLISTAHATTRIAHINADLIREIIPNANAKTIIRGKWTVETENGDTTGKKRLVLEIKETSE
jgi:hypothetical protein